VRVYLIEALIKLAPWKKGKGAEQQSTVNWINADIKRAKTKEA